MSNKEVKTPVDPFQENWVASILNYSVPEPISYSGRNHIELRLGKDYFQSGTTK